MNILFQDEYLLIVDKPAGLLSVPGNSAEKQDCMVSRCQAKFKNILIVHRLDMLTSGIIVFARNKDALRAMNKLFASREIHKTYIAIVDGIVSHDAGEINQPLMVDWLNRPKQKIDSEGKASCTQYQVLSRDKINQTTRVQLTPITGRSHQLRVHMMWLGHAILGDEFYATDEVLCKSTRLLLHASKLAFIHPLTHQAINIHSPPVF
ncbi:MAG: pseudouridine synthase [Mariprofundaceae bacterium]|nr:pseudouridine synthase [Mariprofundaceae bacterium]